MGERGGAASLPPGMEVTTQQIAAELQSLLRDVNNNTSLNAVVQQLEAKLGVDLSQHMNFIRSQIHHFLLIQSQPYNVMTPNHHQEGNVALQLNPNFTSAAPSAHLPLNFTAQESRENYGFSRLPAHQPPQSQPPPQSQSSECPPLPSVKTATASVSGKESAPIEKKRRGGPGGLNKLCSVSPELQIIVGQPTLPRTEQIVKQLWAYIRKHNLQDPNNKRKIICNEVLRLVFQTDCTDMFWMNKLLAKHIITLEPMSTVALVHPFEQTAQNAKKPKVDGGSGAQNDDPDPIVVISEALASVFETDEREMSHIEVLRLMWEYIKVNQLEDPLNSMAIICNAKLQDILGCESISALEMPEMLTRLHLSKKS